MPSADLPTTLLMTAALHRRGMTPLGSPRASGLGDRRLSGYSRHSGYSRLSGQGPGSSVRSASMAPIAGGLDDVPLSLAGTWWTRWGCAICFATAPLLLPCILACPHLQLPLLLSCTLAGLLLPKLSLQCCTLHPTSTSPLRWRRLQMSMHHLLFVAPSLASWLRGVSSPSWLCKMVKVFALLQALDHAGGRALRADHDNVLLHAPAAGAGHCVCADYGRPRHCGGRLCHRHSSVPGAKRGLGHQAILMIFMCHM